MPLLHDGATIGRPVALPRIPDTDLGEMLTARRHARSVLVASWLAFSSSVMLLPTEVGLTLAVCLAGLTSFLESAHGARGLFKYSRRLTGRRDTRIC